MHTQNINVNSATEASRICEKATPSKPNGGNKMKILKTNYYYYDIQKSDEFGERWILRSYEDSNKWVLTCPEPIAAKVLAFHGESASYSYNVLADLKAAGVSYTRRNIIADMFRRLGVS